PDGVLVGRHLAPVVVPGGDEGVGLGAGRPLDVLLGLVVGLLGLAVAGEPEGDDEQDQEEYAVGRQEDPEEVFLQGFRVSLACHDSSLGRRPVCGPPSGPVWKKSVRVPRYLLPMGPLAPPPGPVVGGNWPAPSVPRSESEGVGSFQMRRMMNSVRVCVSL